MKTVLEVLFNRVTDPLGLQLEYWRSILFS